MNEVKRVFHCCSSQCHENIHVGKHRRIVSMENQESEKQVSFLIYMMFNSLNTVLTLVLM